MKEIGPGIYSMKPEEMPSQNIKGTTTISHFDSPLSMEGGSVTLMKELHDYDVTENRCVGVAILNDINSLVKVFWYTGQQLFPKEDLELAAHCNRVVFIFNKFDDPQLEYADSIASAFLPTDTVNYHVLDYVWMRDGRGGSVMCKDNDCCPKEGYDLTGSEETNA